MKIGYQLMVILALAIVLALVLRECAGKSAIVTYKSQLDSAIAAHIIEVDSLTSNLIASDWALRDVLSRQERDSLQAVVASAQLLPVKAEVKRLIKLNEFLRERIDTAAIVRNCDSLAISTDKLLELQDTVDVREHRYDSSLRATNYIYQNKIAILSTQLLAEQRQRQLMQVIATSSTAATTSKWSIGAGAGVSLTADGVKPAAHAGLYYNLFTFKKRK